MKKKYAFIGTGELASDTFFETFDTEEEAIANAKELFKKDIDEEIFGFDIAEGEKIGEDTPFCPIIEVLEVESFEDNYDNYADDLADDVVDYMQEQYSDFESGVDDGDFCFKPEFREEFKKAVLPLIMKYGYCGGASSIGKELYNYDVKEGKKV